MYSSSNVALIWLKGEGGWIDAILTTVQVSESPQYTCLAGLYLRNGASVVTAVDLPIHQACSGSSKPPLYISTIEAAANIDIFQLRVPEHMTQFDHRVALFTS